MPAGVIQAVISELTRSGALNDRQFALLWARNRAGQLRGARRIAEELSVRGVPRAIIDETLHVLRAEYDERASATAFIEQRAARYRHAPRPVQQRRLGRQLARRGFSGELIEDVLGQCLPDHSDR